MKIKNIYTGFMAIALMAFVGCEDKIDPLITDLNINRVLTPTELSVQVQNLTTVRLNWHTRPDVDRYVVEFSEDSLQFNTIIRTVEVLPANLPIEEVLEGSTRYSARVKGVASGKTDSHWGDITFVTGDENIFLEIQPGDVSFTEATLRWPAGSEVTHITLNPGAIQHTITTGEKAAGVALVTGLSSNTSYTARLYNNTKPKGLKEFTTLSADGTVIDAASDLVEVIAAASPGDVLLLLPGNYTVNAGETITLNKSITIKGMYPYDRPKLNVKFEISGGVDNIEIADVELDGGGTLNDVFRYITATHYGTLKIIGCSISDYSRSLIAGNANGRVSSVIIDNVVGTNILTSGGDFIDFRNTHVLDLKVTNSTFNNCSPARDFIRMDNTGDDIDGTYTATVLVNQCTIIGASHPSSRLLYIRFNNHDVTFSKNIVANTTGYFINHGGQGGSTINTPTFAGNNYYEALHLHEVPSGGAPSGNFRYDQSGTHTALNPVFADAANGNFTISNQTLIDNQVGDPRWRP
ncbi:MAG: DUF4957 domain-containing protein [Cyclobacteriaceae bacterium]|nr:DUF4957 domain-containing protein [Cyclobacteriaceae bacterium]